MNEAIELIKSSDKPIYITGKAGTGKTTLLRYILSTTDKKAAVVASTGVAAINAGGITMHKMFGIPFGITGPNQQIKQRLSSAKNKLLNSLELLIIDEVSMVRADTMDFVDKRLRQCRKNNRPFGGLKVVMFGDLFQLPPVVKKDEADIVSIFYESPYFYNAKVFERCGFKIVELTHVFRQSDQNFINLLNDIRAYRITDSEMASLRCLYDARACREFNNDRIHLCALKRDVQKINEMQLGQPTHSFAATIDGDFSISNAPCDDVLQLRMGAKVMMLINDTGDNPSYCNGSLGVVSDITDDAIYVVLDDNGMEIEVKRHTWTAYDYELKGDNIVRTEKGTCVQFPVALAWAITIHKSQGLTFNRVTIHAKNIFAPGQVYVALSRCTSMGGIIVDVPITRRHILPNAELSAFENACRDNGYDFDFRSRELIREALYKNDNR